METLARILEEPFAVADAVLLALISAVDVLVLVLYFRIERAPEKWARTKGRVVRSWIEDGPGTVVPKIEYEYEIGGREFRSQEFWYFQPIVHRPGSSSESPEERAQHFVDGYGAGTPVVVAYDPKHPNHAVVNTERSGVFWLILGLILFDLWLLGTHDRGSELRINGFIVFMHALAWFFVLMVAGTRIRDIHIASEDGGG
jgi:uncharacterized protein DUF3592